MAVNSQVLHNRTMFATSNGIKNDDTKNLGEVRDIEVPKIFFNGLDLNDKDILDGPYSPQSRSDRSSRVPTPSLSDTSLQEDGICAQEPNADDIHAIHHIDIETDLIEREFDYEISSDSLWSNGRLYIDSQGSQSPEQFHPSAFDAPPEPYTQPTGLQEKLFETLQSRDHPEGKRFFPQRAFTDIVNEQAVYDELARNHYQAVDPVGIRNLARTICGDVSFRRVFALLALVAKVGDIEKFIQEGVTDDVLPLRKRSQPGSVLFQLGRGAGPHTNDVEPLRCVEGWNTSVTWMFEDWQWATLAPVFHGGERKDVCHLDLEGRIPLPFLSDSRFGVGSETIRGGYSTVFKVEIHPDHHTFRDLKHGGNQSFAVKCLSTIESSQFDQEVDMLRTFSDDAHPNLISLLATYKQLDKFYLIFPWADADLLSYWREIDPTPVMDHKTVLWVGEQCLGIATGLLGIHRHTTMAVTNRLRRTEDIPDTQIQLYGRHGDMKSNNILWFRNPSTTSNANDRGVLKITDFGLAEFQRSATMIYKSPSKVAASAGYRSPEFDLDDGRIGPSHDVWALGCLCLEFITWLLGGWELVQKFQRAREAKETDECYPAAVDGKFFTITMGNDKKPVARIKGAVTQFINGLHRHSNCTQYVHQFLDLIQTRMIIIKPEDPEAVPRLGTGALTGKLRELVRECQNVDFALNKVPRHQGGGVRFVGKSRRLRTF